MIDLEDAYMGWADDDLASGNNNILNTPLNKNKIFFYISFFYIKLIVKYILNNLK